MTTYSRVAVALISAIGAIGMTGIAAAQPKTEGKAKAPDPGAMAMMAPPAELAEMAKAASGTWKCKGQGADNAMKMADMSATLTIKPDLDNWWVRATFESAVGAEKFRFESFTTYDPKSKKWKRVMVDNGGTWGSGESAGIKNNKVDWNLTMHTPRGDAMFRDHEDLSDRSAVKMWGEVSLDKGKNWIKVYEMTCQK